jgi:hypothetical protein
MVDEVRRRRAQRVALAIGSTLIAVSTVAALEAFAAWRLQHSAWNSFGYRGPILWRKAANELRVMAIGGSTTYGFTVRPEEAYPAQLERMLNEHFSVPVSVANLGHLSDSSVCYEATYRDYRYLDGDIVILYEGYNDVTPTRRIEHDCYRQSSRIFRATGLLPVLPIYARERWYKLRYGDVAAGYQLAVDNEVRRRGDVAAPSKEDAYNNYQRHVLAFVAARLAEGKGVVFASQPYLGSPVHLEQQTRIRVALQPFMTHPRFRYRDFLYLFGGRWDPASFSAQMWLNRDGNRVLAAKFAEAVLELTPAGRESEREGREEQN